MAPEPEIDPGGAGALGTLGLATELLSEADDLTCPNMSNLIEFMVEAWSAQASERGS